MKLGQVTKESQILVANDISANIGKRGRLLYEKQTVERNNTDCFQKIGAKRQAGLILVEHEKYDRFAKIK